MGVLAHAFNPRVWDCEVSRLDRQVPLHTTSSHQPKLLYNLQNNQ